MSFGHVLAVMRNPPILEHENAVREIENAVVVEGALAAGYSSEGPYDVIFVDGAVEVLPKALTDQLKPTGRLAVIEGRGGAGVAKFYQKSGSAVSSRFGFNASVSVLPGFDKADEFVF